MEISSLLQDILANAIDDECGATSRFRFYTAAYGAVIATMAMNTPDPFGASSSGVISIPSAISDAGPAAGTVALGAIYKNATAAATAFVVSMGVAATGQDITMSNTTVATTDTVELSSLSITVPAGTP